jgi:glycerol-3-phosphate O-acyltransferase/dihydroxyacetone phosphate acyltransferase
VHYDNIRLVTAQMHRQIATGTFDAPSWDLIRAAKTATPIYAPLGTAMSLGDYVRVTRTFLEVFKAAHLPDPAPRSDVATQEIMISDQLENKDIVKLKEDLQVSQYLAVTETVFFSERRLAGIPVRIVSVAD